MFSSTFAVAPIENHSSCIKLWFQRKLGDVTRDVTTVC